MIHLSVAKMPGSTGVENSFDFRLFIVYGLTMSDVSINYTNFNSVLYNRKIPSVYNYTSICNLNFCRFYPKQKLSYMRSIQINTNTVSPPYPFDLSTNLITHYQSRAFRHTSVAMRFTTI